MAYELIPMYTPIPKGRQLNVNYKSWIAPKEGSIFLPPSHRHSAIPIVLRILFAKNKKLLSLKSECLYGYKDIFLFSLGTSLEKEEQHILLHNRFD